MVSNPSRQFMVYETWLRKLTEKRAMDERGLKHVSATELDKSPLQHCVERQANSNGLTAMCSDESTKGSGDSCSFLRPIVGSEPLKISAIPVEFEWRQEASQHLVPVETAPAACLNITATNLLNEREVCMTSREVQDYTGQFLRPDTRHRKAGDEGSLINSSTRKDLCFGKINGELWNSIQAQGASPIQLSKTQRIPLLEELQRVLLLEWDTADGAGEINDVNVEERMNLQSRPNALACHVESDNHVIPVFNEETPSEYSDPLRNDSDNNALTCADREAAGNWSVCQTEDEGLGELQASLRPQANPNPTRVEHEPLPLVTTSKVDTQNQTLTVWKDPLSSNGIVHVNSKTHCTNMVSVKGAKVVGGSEILQDHYAEEKIERSRTGKRKRCEEDTHTNLITATKLDGGVASAMLPSNYMGVCFACKDSLTSTETVDCSRNDCDRVYHLRCTVELSDVSWSYEGKLVCPQHVCYACGKRGGARLWRCQNCSLATHENCIPCPEVTTLFHKRPGWAICWRHASDVDYKLKTPTWDCQDIFRHLPVPEEQQEFNLTSEFIKDVMENDKEPPPYFFIRRNVFLIKKKRDDADDGVGCYCKSTQDECGEDCVCRVQSMSCSKDCKCSRKCSNKPFRKDKRLKVVKTAHCGWGVVAAEAIKKDEFVIEYTGEVINDAMCEKRLWEMKGRQSICNFYMCEIAKDFIIDATWKGNASRYLNHSCQPNCRLEKWRVDGETRVGVFAGKNIRVGEQVTYDYKYVEFGPNVKCLCGAPNCRGAIGERFNSNRRSNINLPIKWGCRHKRSSLA